MSFIEFESAREKEKIRDDLRKAREELLKRAQHKAELRADKEAKKVTSGEADWMLPSVSKKFNTEDKKVSKKHKRKEKKVKKQKKSKKLKKVRSRVSSDSDSDNSKRKKRKKDKILTQSSSSSSTEAENDEWIEKEDSKIVKRDDWMTLPVKLKTFSKNQELNPKAEKSQMESYEPATSKLELNKYWKNGGSGLPSVFLKPAEDNGRLEGSKTIAYKASASTANWRKKVENEKTYGNIDPKSEIRSESSSSSESEDEINISETNFPSSKHLTDQQMNELGAKIIKYEILGNNDEAAELRKKLESARALRECTKDQTRQSFLGTNSKEEQGTEEHILLTTIDSKGSCRPMPQPKTYAPGKCNDNHKNKKHDRKNPYSNFADEDRYDIKQMFQREKYTGSYESNAEFVKLAGQYKTSNDDFEDIFNDNDRKKDCNAGDDHKETRNAVRNYEKISKVLDDCEKCFDTNKIEKKLIISVGTSVYLSLPWHVGLQPGHCLITPMQHISCSTELDEDTWEEVSNFRKALTSMFLAQKKDVIFFETAKYLNKRPHLSIHCIPSDRFEMAPFYFKKAIQESESEWCTNKQLISLKNKGLRSSIPRGLPYFWVNFSMESGFAHVLEDQNRFPSNFAQEIIGGMLHLDPSQWRRPQREQNAIAKVKMFADMWKKFDCTD